MTTNQTPPSPLQGVSSPGSQATNTIINSAPRPNDPHMGTTEETYNGSNTYYYAFGGRPLADWSDIDDVDARLLTDLCSRPLDPVSGQKGSKIRSTGLKLKYDHKKQSISDFQRNVHEHLRNHGLDTIGYLQDPKDSSKVLSVVTHHARFTADMAVAEQLSKLFQSRFDKWDKKHDYEAKRFLLDSISDTVRKGFEPFKTEQDSFALTWLKLIFYLVTTTSKTFDGIKHDIRMIRPQNYESQNIETMSKDYIVKAEELNNAGHYNHALTLNMIDGFLSAQRDVKGTFHHELNNLRSKVDTAIQTTTFMSQIDQDHYFATEKLTFNDVCMLAVKHYRSLLHDDLWEPSKLPSDRQAPSVNISRAEVMMIVENMKKGQGKSSKTSTSIRTCFNCGSPDHLIKDCPHQIKKKGKFVPRRKNMSKWKKVAPKTGEPETKTVNGRVFNWCQKCANWTTTHSTATHTGKKNSESTPSSNLAMAEPSAWSVIATQQQNDNATNTASFDFSAVVLPLQVLYLVLSLSFIIATIVSNDTQVFSVSDITSTWYSACINFQQYFVQQWYSYIFPTLRDHAASVMAPLLWFTLGYLACTINNAPAFDFDNPAFRNNKQNRRRAIKASAICKEKESIRNHGLHPSYPMRLRSDSTFKTKKDAPSTDDQFVQEILDYFNLPSTKPSPRPPGKKMSQPFQPFYRPSPTQPPRRRQRRPRWKKSRPSRSTYVSNPVLPCAKCRDDNYMCPSSAKTFESTSTNAFASSFPRPSAPPFPTVPEPSPPRPHCKRFHSSSATRHRKKSYTCHRPVMVTSAHLQPAPTPTALLSPSLYRQSMKNQQKDSFPVIWDTGASICVSPDRRDFVSYTTNVDLTNVRGMSGNSAVRGQGQVHWSILDDNGNMRHFNLKAYHIPSSTARLISTTALLTTYPDETITIFPNHLDLSGIVNNPARASVTAYNSRSTNLPTSYVFRSSDIEAPFQALALNVTTVDRDNINLSDSQKELLRWHQRLGHLSFKKIQHLMRTGVLSNTTASRNLHTAAAKLKTMPKCAACLFGKQTVRPSPGSTSRIVQDRAGILRSGNLLPGAEVSIDHFISSVKGRLFTGFDRGAATSKFSGGCIFIDHCSSFIHIEFQQSLSSHDTLRAKVNFEKVCQDSGVVVKTYMSDNGSAFSSHDFTNHLSNYHQISKFAGVGAHHHNAQAERGIRTIMSIARTMMIHAGIHWPDMAQSSLWPMAVQHATLLWNLVPDPGTGLSPSDLFTKTRWPQRKFHDFHVWGCPVYVLDKALQDGHKIPRWKPRSERTVYMGQSKLHSSQVPLVLSPRTGSLTPQYHVVFDDYFATVTSDQSSIPDFGSDEWNKMFGNSSFQYVIDDDEEDLSDNRDDTETNAILSRQDLISSTMQRDNAPIPLFTGDPAVSPSKPQRKLDQYYEFPPIPESSPKQGNQPTATATTPVSLPQRSQQTVAPSNSPTDVPSASKRAKPQPLSSPRRSRRSAKPVERLTYTHDKKSLTHANDSSTLYSAVNFLCSVFNFEPITSALASVFKASKSKSSPDIFTYEEAMNGEHRDDWIKSALKEIRSLESLNCWKEIPIEQATSQVIPGTWVFRVKRAPDGTFKKFKARYCLRGDLQEGTFDTYAPVVQFSSVRLFLVWSLLLNWYTCSVDFSNAFVQASLEAPTFIHLPRGFRSSLGCKSCLKLNKSIYGLSVAPRLWFEHLWNTLQKLGLKQSKHDKCLLFRHDLIVICYVDDLGIQGPNKATIDKFVQQIRDAGFELTVEGSFTEYLGIQYSKRDSSTIEMTQQGLIKKIIETTGMKDCNPNKVPAAKLTLGSDPDGPRMKDAWNYRSVVGMLLYLTTNTRPDIAFAVSQVARFSHNPKESHASAVKTIVRYLAGTVDRGTIFKKPSKLELNCFVDADFAGLYGSEPSEDSTSVKSRTGYIISLSGCFILCKSQLQTTIALSTSESEYGALSQAMRVLLPIREVIEEFVHYIDPASLVKTFGDKKEISLFQTIIHEDNASALALATTQKITARTKHWAVKSHFFWEHVNDKTKRISIIKVDTKEQQADYLTKGLTKDLFVNCRTLNQGW